MSVKIFVLCSVLANIFICRAEIEVEGNIEELKMNDFSENSGIVSTALSEMPIHGSSTPNTVVLERGPGALESDIRAGMEPQPTEAGVSAVSQSEADRTEHDIGAGMEPKPKDTTALDFSPSVPDRNESDAKMKFDPEPDPPGFTPSSATKSISREEEGENDEMWSRDKEEKGELGIWDLFGLMGKEKGEAGVEDPAPTATSTTSTSSTSPAGSAKLSEKIRIVIHNYRRYGTVTIPEKPFPDPMYLPDMIKKFAGNPVNFTGVRLYGLSNFTVDHINTDLDKMQVYVALLMKKLVILGNYSIKSWFSRASGPFNVTLLDVMVSGSAQLRKDDQGNLEANDTELDMSFMDTIVDFKNIGMLGTLLQGVLASAGPVLFEAVKPAVLGEINTNIRKDVNLKIQNIGQYIGDEKPLDRAIAEGRKYVKEKGYDPYHLKDYVIQEGAFILNISELWLLGLSRFYRVGEVSLLMDSGFVQFSVHLATAKLYGKCKWSVYLGSLSREGATNFTIDRIQARVLVNQSLDVKQHPLLLDLDIHVGKPEIRMHRKDGINLLIEFAINTLPDLLRHIIVDTLEEPIKMKLQSLLNEVDVEEMFEKNLPELDKMGL